MFKDLPTEKVFPVDETAKHLARLIDIAYLQTGE